jgi:predicted esterase
VIDSTPSRVSGLGCPPQYDPVANLPSDASRTLLIAGERDTVVPIWNSEELVSRAKTLGARTEVRPDYAHPFMDRDGETHRSRLNLIKSFLLE